MRTHDQIIVEAGGPTVVARQVGARPGTVKQWRRAGSIPAPYWQAIAQLNLATLDELAEAVAKVAVSVSHADTMAPAADDGAENPERNVSRTDEPGSSATATTLDGPGPAQMVPQACSIEGATGDNAVIRAAPRCTVDAAVHGDADKGVTGGTTAGFGEFRGVEVSQADLDPTVATPTTDGFDTEAVPVPNIDDGSAEGSALGQLNGHGAAIGNALARIGESRCGEQAGGGSQQEKTSHPASLSVDPYREVSA